MIGLRCFRRRDRPSDETRNETVGSCLHCPRADSRTPKARTGAGSFGDEVIVIERNIDANDTINVSSHFRTTLVGLRSAQ